MNTKRAIIRKGNLKYNPMDSHFFFFNERESRWVRMPRKWCELNSPHHYVRLMEAIKREKAQYNAYNQHAYNQAKQLYLEICKTPEKYRKESNYMDIYEAVLELLMYKGHLIGKYTFEVWEDVLKDINR